MNPAPHQGKVWASPATKWSGSWPANARGQWILPGCLDGMCGSQVVMVGASPKAVSYTHLTLPTICSV
eukprot:13361178-Alexandrium_andersonii.AAC.1